VPYGNEYRYDFETEFERTNHKMSPTYEYLCPNGHSEEVVCSMSDHKSSIRCRVCGCKMPQVISGGVDIYGSNKPVSMGTRTIGMQTNLNTDRMSLDAKIHYGTQKYQELNPNINPELARQDRKDKIERETQKIIKGHKR